MAVASRCRVELRAVNKGTLTEFEQYTAKISELRAQLVASAVWPNWIETDWREYLAPPETPAAALYYK